MVRFGTPAQIQDRTVAARYSFAVLAGVFALALRNLLTPWIGTQNPYHTLWAAVVFSAWYCGVGPAIVTTGIGLAGVWYWFLSPSHSFSMSDPRTQAAGMVSFALLSGFIIALGETNRRSQVRKRLAEDAVVEKESEFHLLADSIPELCWMAREDGYFTWYNRRWYDYTGTTAQQAEGWGWQSVHDPKMLPSVLDRWKASLAHGQAFEMEFPLRRADGVFRWFLTRIKPFHASDGKVVRWFGTSTDIDEQRQLQQSLVGAREQLELRVGERTAELEKKATELLQKAILLDLANDAIFVRDADDKISYWNEGAERLYGWRASDAVGHSTHEMLHTEFPVPLEYIFSRDNWEGELRHTKRDGNQIVVASRWTTLRDRTGKATGWLELNTDITGRKRAELAARQLASRLLTLQDDERRRIARDLHDGMGQNLVAVKMNLDYLSKTGGPPGAIATECSDIVDGCLTEIRTMSHLLHPPLLDEAGLRSAIRWYVDGFGERSGIEVKLDLPSTPGRLPERVETTVFRIVQEALINVHRHSGCSVVSISLDVDAENLQLEVRDNGKGIPRDRLQGVLEFGIGTGVGLAGMRERIRELGGTLNIESDQSGTLLRAAIPITGTPGQAPPLIQPTRKTQQFDLP